MFKHPLVTLAVALAVALSAAAQDQTTQKFTSGTHTVPVFVTVTDRDKRLVPDLGEEDFEIYDNGKLQKLTQFDNSALPISVVVMLDTSGSMTVHLDLLKHAAENFVIRLLPFDRARIGSFSDKIDLSPQFTSDRDALIRYLREGVDFGNPTRLWDAGMASMDALSEETNRRVVLLFTDGDDTASQDASLGDLLRRAQAEDFMFYGIGLRSQVLGRSTRPDPGLRRLATETGGGYFELRSTDELGSTFGRVADELHRQYVLGFTPENLDGKVHKLEIEVKRPGMTVRARKTYVAQAAR
jgi:Ca-activated chloride channel family protein